LAATLRAAGYEPRPGCANWLLVDGPELRDRLAARAILVRDCASFGLPGTVRIAVPNGTGLARLEAALTAPWAGP
jgi:histidinol-phosphate/aromatic aminotransferase/cobyric acid decarboxylase-like protein